MKTLHLSIIALFVIGLISIHSVNGVLVDNTFIGSYVVKDNLALINNQTYYISKPYDSYDSNQTIIFHNVVFAMPTAYTSPPDPSGIVFSLVKFPDGSTEKLGVGVPLSYPLTALSTHTSPQAAFTRFMNNTFVFLVSHDLEFSSPLKQFKSGIKAGDIKCNNGLSLVVKAEDNSPACITPQTAQKLTEGGWALTRLTINGLKETYGVGEKIDFMIDFQGLLHYCDYPHVSVLDSNQNIVWKSQDVNSMCVSAPFSPLPYVSQRFDLNSGYGGPIVINKTGNYIMKVSLYSSSVEKGFTVK